MVSELGGNDGVLAVLGWDGQSRVNRCVRMGEVFWHRREEGTQKPHQDQKFDRQRRQGFEGQMARAVTGCHG